MQKYSIDDEWEAYPATNGDYYKIEDVDPLLKAVRELLALTDNAAFRRISGGFIDADAKQIQALRALVGKE